MPELPEVELIRRHLDDTIRDRRVESAVVTHPRTARRNASAVELTERLIGRRFGPVGRIGKFIDGPLDDGSSMVLHLGMSGRVVIDRHGRPADSHTRFSMVIDDGTEIRLVDPRTFGFVAVLTPQERAGTSLATIGPDAWSDRPAADELARALAGRRAPIKALLLDQGVLAGLGNIYADEVLFLAGIHPLTPGDSIVHEGIERLAGAVDTVLAGAIAAGGTSLDDLAYLLPDGRAGENLGRLMVYGREGERCRRCGATIQRVVIRSRSAHYCPSCQA